MLLKWFQLQNLSVYVSYCHIFDVVYGRLPYSYGIKTIIKTLWNKANNYNDFILHITQEPLVSTYWV